MQARKLLAIALLAIVGLSGFLAGHQYANNSQALDNAMHVELYLYKNGQLVYYDPDDPATYQFTALIAEFIAGDLVTVGKDTGGSSYAGISDTGQPGYVFVSYSQSYTYNYNMYGLPASYDSGQISTGGVSFDNTTKSVTFSATVNIQQNATIYGVGLYTALKNGNGAIVDFVLFYDPLSNPITVHSGDVVTVVYKITVP